MRLSEEHKKTIRELVETLKRMTPEKQAEFVRVAKPIVDACAAEKQAARDVTELERAQTVYHARQEDYMDREEREIVELAEKLMDTAVGMNATIFTFEAAVRYIENWTDTVKVRRSPRMQYVRNAQREFRQLGREEAARYFFGAADQGVSRNGAKEG